MTHIPPPTAARDILIERNSHYCKVNNFLPNLGHLFKEKDDLLLCCKHLNIDKKLNSLDAHKKMIKFCKIVVDYQNINTPQVLKQKKTNKKPDSSQSNPPN